MSDTTLRVRALVATWWTPLVVAAVLLSVVGAGGVYATHVDPPADTEERVTGEWGVTGGFDHRATVTRENPVFPVGTTLENRTTYFVGATPEFDGTFSLSPDAARNVTVALDATLVLSSRDEEGTTYWEATEDLGERRAEGVEPGESVGVDFSVNASRVDERLSGIEAELGSSPGTPSAAVAVEVRAAGTVDGERTTLRFTERLPVAVGTDAYAVESPGPVSESVPNTEVVTVPREYGPVRSVGTPLLLLLGLTGVAAMAVADRRDALELTDAERELLAFRDDRTEFDEWIVRIALPTAALERPRAEAASLGDLVDFAIDSDTGVVEAPDGDAFYVLGEEYLFTYTPPVAGEDDPGEADAELGAAGDGESRNPADASGRETVTNGTGTTDRTASAVADPQADGATGTDDEG